MRALGATLVLWREDYAHPDGWPQRYKITLTFTGFTTGATPVVLPAYVPDDVAARSLLVSPTI